MVRDEYLIDRAFSQEFANDRPLIRWAGIDDRGANPIKHARRADPRAIASDTDAFDAVVCEAVRDSHRYFRAFSS
jgi:hypothetical protein